MIRAALRALLDGLRSYWVFFWRERFGYRRRSTLTAETIAERELFLRRIDRLKVDLAIMDTTQDLWRLDANGRPKQK